MLAVRLALTGLIVCGTSRLAAAEELRIAPAVLSVIEESQVAAEEAGVVRDVWVVVGQSVDAGTKLAQLDDRDAQLELERARIEYERAMQAANDIQVRSAREALNLAELDLQRAREAVDRYAKSVSGAQIDRLKVIAARAHLDVEHAEHEAEAARMAANSAEHAMKIAARGLDRRQVVAPIAGTVVTVDARRGERLEPGDPVVRILNIERLRAEGFVEFDRVRHHEPVQNVTFSTRSALGESVDVRGQLTFVSPEVNRVNGQVRVWADVDNSQRLLRPGMTGTLILLGASATEESSEIRPTASSPALNR